MSLKTWPFAWAKPFGEALGDKKGIVRMANVAVPMDETLVTVVGGYQRAGISGDKSGIQR